MRRHLLVGTLLATALLATQARADNAPDSFSIDFGAGYARLNIDGSAISELDNADTVAGSFHFNFLNATRSNWRLGVTLHVVSAWEETDPFVLDGEVFDDDPFKEFSMIVPMLRLGYNFDLGNSGWFIEPSINVGPSFGYFRAGEDRGNWWDEDNEIEERWEVGIAVQPALQVGYSWDNVALGVETAYLWTHLDFDDEIGGDITEFYLGGFFRWSF